MNGGPLLPHQTPLGPASLNQQRSLVDEYQCINQPITEDHNKPCGCLPTTAEQEARGVCNDRKISHLSSAANTEPISLTEQFLPQNEYFRKVLGHIQMFKPN